MCICMYIPSSEKQCLVQLFSMRPASSPDAKKKEKLDEKKKTDLGRWLCLAKRVILYVCFQEPGEVSPLMSQETTRCAAKDIPARHASSATRVL